MRDREVLARYVTSPAHIKKPLPGELSDSFFEEVFTHGLSVQRLRTRWRVASKHLHRLGERFAELKRREEIKAGGRATRLYLGVLHLDAGAVRRAYDATKLGPKRIRIYDTAIRGNRHHAEVMGDLSDLTSKEGKAFKLEVRTRLLVLAWKQGIFKSPHLAANDPNLVALNTTVIG